MDLRLPPKHLLACPRCGADIHSGLAPETQQCHHCGQQFFDLNGLPCWFSVGLAQRTLWQSLYGLAMQHAEHNFRLAEEAVPLDLPASSRRRAQQIQAANRQIIEDVQTLLDHAGLAADIAPEFANYDASRMLQYFELLLRDWAWDAAVPAEHNENRRELARLQQAVAATGVTLGDCLVMGAGAGRLSWDMQIHLQPQCTLALDTNPVLISAAHRLVAEQNPWHLTELQPNPQAGLKPMERWCLQAPPGDASARERWFALAGNAWSPPLRAAALDTLVTPWFIDVNGKDVRTLIGQVQKLLKPGGHWINTGPLLYGSDIAPMRRYTIEEIVELLQLAGFEVLYQNLEITPYLKTPLSHQLRTEQVWTFVARAPQPGWTPPVSQPPAWIVLPHLAIPPLQTPAPEDPTLQQLLSLVDGKRSIADIAQRLAPNLDPGQDPVALVQAVFMTFLLE